MNPRKRQKLLIEEKEPSGVPLGGVGAGCIEFGRDGRFRNITINNNRTTETRIPVSPGAFVAVRAALKGKVVARLMQSSCDLPFASAGIAQFTEPDDLGWSPLYPSAAYGIRLDPLPVEVRWSAMSTVIPYDLDASTLPLILMTVSFRNTGDLPVDVAAVVNWENLCRCSRGVFPADRGGIRPVVNEPDSPDSAAASGGEHPPHAIGLRFGTDPPYAANHEGNYTLIAAEQINTIISYAALNGKDPLQLGEFWSNFRDAGDLGNTISRDSLTHHGAVCCSAPVDPNGGELRFVYAFAWYFPMFESGGKDLGNGYANAFRDSIEVAKRGIYHRNYYIRAIRNWQNAWLDSSLPRWYSKMLLNSNGAFSTNTLYTSSGRMAMFETPSDPITTCVNRRLHTSLATLLCLPEFEKMELVQAARAYDELEPGRICHNLGKLTVHGPNRGPGDAPALDVNPAFILMVYRNFLLTGHRPSLENVYPRLVEAVDYLHAVDEDQDGLPDHQGVNSMYLPVPVYGANSYTAGLWIAALRAFVLIAQRLKKPDDAQRAQSMFDKAVASLQRRLWSERDGYYRFFNSSKPVPDPHARLALACHAGQLAGAWYCELLGMGPLFPHQNVDRALDTIQRILERQGLVQNLAMPDASSLDPASGAGPGSAASNAWLSYNLAHYASLQIYNGNVDRGLVAVQKMYDTIHAALGRPFSQPLEWDIESSRPAGWAQERHMSSLAAWNTLYALQGVLLNVPDRVLWVCPNLPRNVYFLDAPIMTPLCMGAMRFRETPGATYQQEVEVSFQSPVSVQAMVLRVPPGVDELLVKVHSDAGDVPVTHVIGYQGKRHLLQITAAQPIQIQAALSVRVLQVRRQQASTQ